MARLQQTWCSLHSVVCTSALCVLVLTVRAGRWTSGQSRFVCLYCLMHHLRVTVRAPVHRMRAQGVNKLGDKRAESKCALVFGQMNEPPGARARVALTGLTIAEHFRDHEGQDVLLFVDNIFRFTQVRSQPKPPKP